jgi:hypothetical protein
VSGVCAIGWRSFSTFIVIWCFLHSYSHRPPRLSPLPRDGDCAGRLPACICRVFVPETNNLPVVKVAVKTSKHWTVGVAMDVIWRESPREGDHSEDRCVYERMGSEWILGRRAGDRCGVDSVSLGYGPVAGSCGHGDELSGSAPAALYPPEMTPNTHWTGGWMGLRAGLDTEAKEKILLPLQRIESRSPGRPRYTD